MSVCWLHLQLSQSVLIVFVYRSVQQLHGDLVALSETCLLTLHLEIRCHCFYFLLPAARQVEKTDWKVTVINSFLSCLMLTHAFCLISQAMSVMLILWSQMTMWCFSTEICQQQKMWCHKHSLQSNSSNSNTIFLYDGQMKLFCHFNISVQFFFQSHC